MTLIEAIKLYNQLVSDFEKCSEAAAACDSKWLFSMARDYERQFTKLGKEIADGKYENEV